MSSKVTSSDHQEDQSPFLDGDRDTQQRLQPIISPSLMVADQAQLLMDSLHVLSTEGGGVEWLHVDVIDGHFAPNMSFCPDTVRGLRKHMPRVFLDCHLMVTDPEQWIKPFASAGASGFTFHYEVTGERTAAVCEAVRAAGMKAGVAVKPATPVDVLFPLVDAGAVDLVLIMTVEPGFAGQPFMPGPLSKVAALRRRYPLLNIQVDGAINLQTVERAAKAGANVLVPGQAVFKAPDRKVATETLRDTVRKYLHTAPVDA